MRFLILMFFCLTICSCDKGKEIEPEQNHEFYFTGEINGEQIEIKYDIFENYNSSVQTGYMTKSLYVNDENIFDEFESFLGRVSMINDNKETNFSLQFFFDTSYSDNNLVEDNLEYFKNNFVDFIDYSFIKGDTFLVPNPLNPSGDSILIYLEKRNTGFNIEYWGLDGVYYTNLNQENFIKINNVKYIGDTSMAYNSNSAPYLFSRRYFYEIEGEFECTLINKQNSSLVEIKKAKFKLPI